MSLLLKIWDKQIKLAIMGFILVGILCGCAYKSERIVLYGQTDRVADNTTITLKKGYFVEDYDINYENNWVILYLTKENP